MIEEKNIMFYPMIMEYRDLERQRLEILIANNTKPSEEERLILDKMMDLAARLDKEEREYLADREHHGPYSERIERLIGRFGYREFIGKGYFNPKAISMLKLNWDSDG